MECIYLSMCLSDIGEKVTLWCNSYLAMRDELGNWYNIPPLQSRRDLSSNVASKEQNVTLRNAVV